MKTNLFILAYLFLFFRVDSVFAITIKINEFYAAGSTSSNPDWVEIYNDGADISEYQLRDSSINNKKDLAGATCNGNFCTIDWYNYLNNSGDTIKLVLKTAIDSPTDQVTYPGDISIPSSGQSAGRNPDLTGGWVIFSSPTKGVTNNTGVSAPTPTPTPVSTSTPSPTDSPISSFLISNIPSQINSDQSFKVTVNLSLPDKPNTKLYLKGAFRHPDKSSNYFGMTKVSGNWVKNGSSYSNQFPITTGSSGNWSGNLEVKPDTDDSGFTGSGDYIFKVGRYKESDNPSVIWSNESNIDITSTAVSTQQNTSASTSKTTPSSNPSHPSLTSQEKRLSKSTQSPKFNYQIASIAAVTASATPTTQISVKSQKQTNYFVWAGIVLILTGTFSIGYIYLRKHASIHIKFRKRD